MDPDLARYETVWAAAGTANAVFPLAPNTLRILTAAVVTQITAAETPIVGESTASVSTNA
jgi:prolyl-tRNA editing enzyme YbaK/EbsC (Cys-tRNA(Pro) deacylase)